LADFGPESAQNNAENTITLFYRFIYNELSTMQSLFAKKTEVIQ